MPLEHVLGARCMACGRLHPLEATAYLCPDHPEMEDWAGGPRPYATLDISYDYERIGATTNPARIAADPDRAIGRYERLLPIVGRDSLAPLPVGDTPLLPAPRLAARLGLRDVWVKDDGRNPTASLKDRASAVVVARARELGLTTVATASTGNAAASLAGQMAVWPQGKCVIFVPATAPPAKLAQLLVYGATVLAVEGSYDQAFDLCTAACERFGWYNRNTGMNPFTSEGKKTVSYEICEGLARHDGRGPSHWSAPAVVLVPVGDGSIIGGVYKGLADALALGWIDHMPRIIGVQSERSNALAQAWRQGKTDDLTPVQATTLADSISVDWPRDARKALRAVRASNGAYVEVSDEAILEAMKLLARAAGVFAEPAAAAATAGLLVAVEDRLIAPHERVVILSTGNGLKDIASARRAAGEPQRVAADIAAVAKILNSGDERSESARPISTNQ
jgi:threonine synthase